MPLYGLYESIITESLSRELESVDENKLSIGRRKLHSSEAGDRLALHLGKVLMSALSSVSDEDRVEVGVRLARKLIENIDTAITKAEVGEDQVLASKEVLTSVLAFNPDGSAPEVTEPLTPLLDTRAFWFLGPATDISHESEGPMGITWKLDEPLPGDLFSVFAAAVA